MINYKTFISEEHKEPIIYHVVHKTSGQVVGKAKTRNRASRILDRKDNDYGGYAHIVKPIYEAKFLTTNKNSMSTVLSQPGLYPAREKKINNINYHKSGFSAGVSGSPHQSDMVPKEHKEKYSSGFDQGRTKREELKKNKVDIPARTIVKNIYGETKPNKHYVKFLQTQYSKED